MNDERSARVQARQKLIGGITAYADCYEAARGGVVTGWVTVYEITMIDGARHLMWATGDGAEPSEDHERGLDEWRVEGMLAKAMRDIHGEKVMRQGDP